MSNISGKFVNILNKSVDKFNWICGWNQMNSLMNFNEFVDEFKNDDSREFIKEFYFKKILKNDQFIRDDLVLLYLFFEDIQ